MDPTDSIDMMDPTPQPLIIARGLTRSYPLGDGAVIGINAVNLMVAAGEMVVLKGNSGSGKSTLLSLLAGLDRPTGGELVVAGHSLSGAGGVDLTRYRREVVGMVFQSFNLLPTLDVLENVCLPALLAEKPAEPVRNKALELLDWLGLRNRLHHTPAQLSGGEMQRTAIARALINDPALILADEPTGNLDSRNGRIVIDLLSELNRRSGRTVVVATHSDLADDLATVRIRLQDGALADPPCHS
ncbi:MAG: ABC transporter ATP-binding protein [Desulfobacterales bacterium]|jgi:ABC-type lipoprotein export system ATPase subunit|nr:ABC transporter ATP-binding protein [Desulfobacterales bacterium]